MNKTRYLLLILMLFFGKSLFAQAPAWGGGADQADYSFGFTFQYVNSYFKIDKKPNWRNPYYDPGVGHTITDSVSSISSPGSPGFAVGFLARYDLTDFPRGAQYAVAGICRPYFKLYICHIVTKCG